MLWIDPTCLPETQGAIEGFITNRHGEIDRLVAAEARPTSLLVCTPPHMAEIIAEFLSVGATVAVCGEGLHLSTDELSPQNGLDPSEML